MFRFTATEGAGDHCEAGVRTLYHARSFGWLDRMLAPDSPLRCDGDGDENVSSH
jgi:hypothetical protein